MKSVYIPSGLSKVHPGLEPALKSIQNIFADQQASIAAAASSNSNAAANASLISQLQQLTTIVNNLQVEINSGEKSYTAVATIRAFAAVVESAPGFVMLADSSSVAGVTNVVGISTNTANAGGEVLVAGVGGTVINTGWTWIPRLPVFIGSAGFLTQTPGTLQISIGTAISATSILVSPELPVLSVNGFGYVGVGNPLTLPQSQLDVFGSFGAQIVETASRSFSLADAFYYCFTGVSPGVWSMPLLAASQNRHYIVKNTGSASLTLTGFGSSYSGDNFYNTSSSHVLTIPAGSWAIISAASDHWLVCSP
jgi:hypothetical protein